MSGMPPRIPWAIAAAVILALGVAGWWWFPTISLLLRPPPVTVASKPAAVQPASSRPSIAVLPFINLSGDPSQEYFSDGMTEDVIVALGRFGPLSVMARNAVFP